MHNPKQFPIPLYDTKPPSPITHIGWLINPCLQLQLNDSTNFLIYSRRNRNILLNIWLMCNHRKFYGWEEIQMKCASFQISPSKSFILLAQNWSINLISSSHKKFLCSLTNASHLSAMYLPVGWKGGGTFSKTGIFSKGSP